ncbi:MAG: alanine racemase [Flavobacteriales bacterium]|nr:alanine racemase [Flavobacteriales bacterium]
MKRIKQMDKLKGHSLSEFSDNELEISWDAIQYNLSYFRQKLHPNTKLMLMVKASAYGHSTSEIVSKIQSKNLAHYLGVATIAEGIELRNNGIELPIMIQNVRPNHWDVILHHCLEPVIHSFEILESFHSFLLKSDTLKENRYPIHIKLNTGMNRLGFNESDLSTLKIKLLGESSFRVSSIMSHLSSSGNFVDDEFTLHQITDFKRMSDSLITGLAEKPICHILNTDGIHNYLAHQMDMVRLGIGLYGASESEVLKSSLNIISKLTTRVVAVRKISKNEFISYNRSGELQIDSHIAVLSLGYADGLPRKLGNGNWEIEIEGKLYPTIGNICMDLCMINLGQDKVALGSKAIVFGGIKSIFDYANALDTITYEALTNIGNRVKRILV